jgi:Tol biopolymer transport system component
VILNGSAVLPAIPTGRRIVKRFFLAGTPPNKSQIVFINLIFGSTEPLKTSYIASQKASAINSGVYNSTNTQLAFVYRGDIFLLDLKTNATTRVTQTEDFESNPKFINNNEWLVYTKNQNLFSWNIKTGATRTINRI